MFAADSWRFSRLPYIPTRFAKHKSLTKAAAELFATQQNLSSYLKRLDDHYQVPSLIRKPKFELTDFGKGLLDCAQRIQGIYQQIDFLTKNLTRAMLSIHPCYVMLHKDLVMAHFPDTYEENIALAELRGVPYFCLTRKKKHPNRDIQEQYLRDHDLLGDLFASVKSWDDPSRILRALHPPEGAPTGRTKRAQAAFARCLSSFDLVSPITWKGPLLTFPRPA